MEGLESLKSKISDFVTAFSCVWLAFKVADKLTEKTLRVGVVPCSLNDYECESCKCEEEGTDDEADSV